MLHSSNEQLHKSFPFIILILSLILFHTFQIYSMTAQIEWNYEFKKVFTCSMMNNKLPLKIINYCKKCDCYEWIRAVFVLCYDGLLWLSVFSFEKQIFEYKGGSTGIPQCFPRSSVQFLFILLKVFFFD